MELRFEQPCTIEDLLQLDVELLAGEISRLQNSINHLKRSNIELEGFVEDEEDQAAKSELLSVIAENDLAVEKQQERIQMINHAIQQKIGLDTSNPHYLNLPRPELTSIPAVALTPQPGSDATGVQTSFNGSYQPQPLVDNLVNGVVRPHETGNVEMEDEQTGVYL